MTIFIDCPHGGADPGTSGNGLVEKTQALKMALYKYDRFKALGVPVKILRTKDATMSNEQRTKIIRESGAKICLSGHLNGFSNKEANGAETIYSVFSDGKLANMILDGLAKHGLTKRRAFKKAQSDGKDWYYMHRLTGNVQTVIIEYGFITNKKDADIIKARWKELVEEEVKATISYLNTIGYKYEYVAPKAETKAEPGMYYTVQAGSFREKPNAEKRQAELKKAGFDSFLRYEKR